MRVLMVSSFLHPRGGDTTCIATTTRALQARGHEVIPFAMRHPDNLPSVWEAHFPAWHDPRSAAGLERLAATLKSVWSPDAARALEGLLREVRVDVAHLHHVHRHLTPAVLGPLRRRGIRIVWTVHDYELICPAATLWVDGAPCERCRGHHYMEAVRHRCKRGDLAESIAVAAEKTVHARLGVWDRVDRFLCPSQYCADRLARFGIDPARIVHLPNPVEPAPLPTQKGEGWAFAGRLSEVKGADVLAEAAKRVPHSAPIVCGDGPSQPALRAAGATLLGTLRHRAVATVLRKAAVVVVPSIWPENDPYAVLEGQLAGRAVVASRVGGIPEQIRDGEDGVLVPPGDPAALADAVRGLLADPARASRIGVRAHRRVCVDRDPGRYVARLERLYGGIE